VVEMAFFGLFTTLFALQKALMEKGY